MKQNELMDRLSDYEKRLESFLHMNPQQPDYITDGFKLFCEVYAFYFTNQRSFIQGRNFYAVNIVTKKIVPPKDSIKYFTKYPIRLKNNLQTLLNITQVYIQDLYATSLDFSITQLSMRNYRRFLDETLIFDEGINIIVGNNGAGKTSILDAISSLVSQYLKAMDIPIRKSLTNNSSEFEIEACFKYNDTELVASSKLINSFTSENGESTLFLLGKANKANLNTVFVFPIIVYYCISKENIKSEYTKNIDSRLRGYNGCLLGRTNLEEVKRWLSESPANHSNHFLKVVNSFTENIDSDLTGLIKWDKKKNELLYVDKSISLLIENLSSGYKQIINLVIDLAYRARILNPERDSPESATGIVLIDEIDLHLHPKWQWTVLNALHKTFSNIQFIVTTHSPFILSSIENCNTIVITDEIIYPSNIYGKSISNIARLVLGTNEIPQELQLLLYSFEKAWDANNYEYAEVIVKTIREKYGTENEIYSKLNRKLKFKFD